MKKGCAMTLLVWAACVLVYARIAWPLVREVMPTAILAFLGGTFAAMLIGATIGLFTSAGDRAAYERALRREPPADGRMEAVSGPVRPLGAPLEAPFSGRPCVAYEYDVKGSQGGASDRAGVALAPSAIDGPLGPARLLSFAMLDKFPASPASGLDRARAERYLAAAATERLGVGNAISEFLALAADDDGSVRKDFRMNDGPVSLEGRHLEEKIVPVGATVTAVGIWSQAKGGFAPSGKFTMLRLFPGPVEKIAAAEKRTPMKAFLTSLLMFAALHAILVPMYFLARANRAREARPAPPPAAAPEEPGRW